MTLGERIYDLRKSLGLSQAAFAEEIGVSRQSVSKWETNEAVPDTDNILTLSRLFGVSADYLLNGEKAPSAEPEQKKSSPEKAPGGSKKRRYTALIVFMCVLAAALAVTAEVLLTDRGSQGPVKTPEAPARHAFILVHGLGGWGEKTGVNNLSKYWGADTGDLVGYLRGEGYEVYAPSVGPVSSTWDRCCELYAILTGTRVDYGEAHSLAHNHARYGRIFSEALLPDWGENKVIDLIGHSFGGATVREFASLLACGAPEEVEASGEGVSPLFTGGKAGLVNSVTTLCAPHNGSSLTCIIDDLGGIAGIGNGTQLLAAVCFAAAGLSSPADGIYDFMLDQFGIGEIRGGLSAVTQAISSVRASGNDHAGYELTPDGAAELNKKIITVPGVYYFSYSWCTTQQSPIGYTQVPISGTLPVLYPFALAMGSYNGKTPGGIDIDSSWLPNDGLVSVVSAEYPSGAEHIQMPEELSMISPGIWNVADTKTGDHGTVIGMQAAPDETHAFYDELFSMLKTLKAGE